MMDKLPELADKHYMHNKRGRTQRQQASGARGQVNLSSGLTHNRLDSSSAHEPRTAAQVLHDGACSVLNC